MNNPRQFFDILSAVTVDCKDNGEEFTVTERINVIEGLLAGSAYKLIVREPLALLFAKKEFKEYEKVLLVSSHIDCVHDKCFCNNNGEYFCGTFDNSFGNAAALWCMLNETLPENVVVAFTGDEEKGSAGAVQALLALGRGGYSLSSVIVQDVTNEGWESGALFTIENDSGFNLLQAHKIVSSLESYSGKFAYKHNAEPDESWDYAEYGLPCFTLCVPVQGNMHGNEGVLMRKESAVEYCKVLALLAKIIS